MAYAFFHLKPLETATTEQACAGCRSKEADLTELRVTGDNTNRRVLLLCDDCLGNLHHALKIWAKQPVKV